MRFATATLWVLIVGVFLISPVQAQAQDEYGLDTVAGKAQLTGLGSDVPKITGRFLGAVLSLVGILFFILTIYGGVLWMTSHGNAEQATKGLQTTIAAIIGLVIVLAAYTITSFVFKTVEGGEGVAGGPINAPAGSVRAGSSCTSVAQCESRTTCSDGRCQSFCDIQYGSQGYTCRERSGCDVTTIKVGECPGGTNFVCCLTPTQGGQVTSRCVESPVSPCAGVSQTVCPSIGGCVWNGSSCVWRESCDFLTVSECTNHSYCRLQ